MAGLHKHKSIPGYLLQCRLRTPVNGDIQLGEASPLLDHLQNVCVRKQVP